MQRPTLDEVRTAPSLRRRLPLLISGLLIVVVGAVSWSAYLTLEDALVSATRNRLSGASQRLADMLGESARRGLADARQMVADSVFLELLTRPSAAARERATSLLKERRTRGVQATSLVLWDTAGRSVLVVGSELPEMRAPPTGVRAPTDSSARAETRVGPLVRSDSGVIYEVVVPVMNGNRTVVGNLVGYSRLASGRIAASISGLIGSDALMLIGNKRGDVWTDLSRSVRGPPPTASPGELVQYTDASDVSQLGMSSPIASTPWQVMVQMPRRTALAPATRFVLNVTGILLVCMALGSLGAWLLSDQVTAPLAEVTRAAEDVAQGDYARRVVITRSDELGRLARSFNAMAEQVQAASRDQMRHARQLESTNVALRDSESRYRQLVEVSPDALIVHRDQRILFANAAAATMVGATSPGALIDRAVTDFVPNDERPEFAAQMQIVQRERLRLPLAEGKLQRQAGTQVDVEMASTPFTMDGQSAVLTVVRDITERMRLEERIRQSQKMEAVGQLAGGVAHDFNNLLTVITSYCGMLLVEVPPTTSAWADIKEISDAADRAAALTRQLLAFSRQQVFEPRVLELNPIVADVEKMLRRVIPASIEITTRLAPDVGRIFAEPGHIEQVLMNLSVNARDAMPAGGALVVETSNVVIGEDDAALFIGAVPGPYVLLTVSDTGSGMTAERQSHMFEPFFTTKEPGKGTGLGLSTVYGIVKQSGGHIWVYSETGQGTIFKVYLPRVDAEPTPVPDIPSDIERTRGHELVLLAEDEAPVRLAARRILERWGYSVLVASSGQEAMALFAQYGSRINALITDMVMPDMNGRQLASRIRAVHPNVAILCMSGYTEETVLRQNAAEPGAVFVQKPFTPDALTQKLREALAIAANTQ